MDDDPFLEQGQGISQDQRGAGGVGARGWVVVGFGVGVVGLVLNVGGAWL
jgi:hypothetical protein